MVTEIFKTGTAIDKDNDVPEFGGFTSQELRKPISRKEAPDLKGKEALQSLKTNAVRRAVFFAYNVGETPPVHFPNGEHFQHICFTHDHWNRFGNMESEQARVAFMLDSHESRRFPQEFDQVVKKALNSKNPLGSWGTQFQILDEIKLSVFEDISSQMANAKELNGYKKEGDREAFQTLPIFYTVSEEGGELEKELWEESLFQISKEMQEGNFGNLYSFLHLYRHVKDPITPIRHDYLKQAEIFKQLYRESRSVLEDQSIEPDSKGESILVTQLALESSFLALPGAADIAAVVYRGHHELPYIYVDLAQFPRGEFANPERVITVFHDLIVDSESHDEAVCTPVTVSYFHDPYQKQPELFIIDGNNRATAILLMKFLDFVNFEESQIVDYEASLEKFASLYDLDVEWEKDLLNSLEWLLKSGTASEMGYSLETLLSNKEMVKTFARSHIPALFVQEPNFHTVAVALSQDSKIVLLQPMHQTIYNARKSGIAIPSKQQSHGRAGGNDLRISVRSEVVS